MMVKLKIKSAALATAAAAAANNGPPIPPPTPAQQAAAPHKPKKTPKALKDKSSTTSKSAHKTPGEPKPKKTKTSKQKSASTPSAAAAAAAAASSSAATGAAASRPSPAPPAVPKIRLKTSASSAGTPKAAATPPPPPPAPAPAPLPSSSSAPTPKAARPTLKLTSSSFNAAAAAAPGPTSAPAATPTIKLRTKSKPNAPRKRRHEPGNGYDSEASDREDDPAIEEQFILRMPPGPDCEYLREVIERKELSVTSDVWLKFKDPRRAVVNVRGHLYSACLVDLPCVIEANKTLDKKNIFKTADICQMLLVSDRIQHEDEAWGVATRFQDITYGHGLTPPMQHVRRRRFRKRISNRTIEAVETEVDRLLRDDEAAKTSKFDLIDAGELAREGTVSDDGEEGYDLLGYEDAIEEVEEVDAEGDYDFGVEEMDEDTLANDLESALMAEADPAPVSEDSDEDDDEEPLPASGQNPPPELDEAAQEAAQRRSKLLEEIEDLKDALGAKEREYMGIANTMLKARVGKVIAAFRDELGIKHKELAGL